jgi:hypothetical protein
MFPLDNIYLMLTSLSGLAKNVVSDVMQFRVQYMVNIPLEKAIFISNVAAKYWHCRSLII